ncbi:MAG: undecaprenyl-diphosphate phosphatase [Alphaproteobacteria bacterium]|uniref:Undecaprenyl-diphosphatase n=1 Tax=Candidatus Nitrobium versatile TaxID=2884831 RepID=A0A953M2W5_9BACT|nr:undecaprenyl-diphosphate phosphatase [Candidatus Nitrobium versatile]
MENDFFRAIILGIVQGLTEFLPVSSTAHLILFPWFFGWRGQVDTLAFDVALHGGTLLALLVCFYRDWVHLFLNDRRMLAYILAGIVPAGAAGILLNKHIESTLRNPLLIIFTLIGFGVLMVMAERLSRKSRECVSMSDSLFVGVAQAIALVPGVSRSGITITAGLFKDLTRESAARFSFLLSTPVVAGAVLLEGRKLVASPEVYHFDIILTGIIASFVSGYLAIRFLLGFLKRHPLHVFVYYRFALAAIIGVWWLRQ